MAPNITIRPPTPDDQPAFLAAAHASRALHKPWVTAPTSPSHFCAYLDRIALSANASLLVLRKDNQQIVGVFNITNMVFGPFCSAYLGYYAFAGHQGQGLMRAGLQAVVRHAFRTLKLHRLEANIQPDNTRSIALVSSVGFLKEGYSPRYLKIGGRWRDHERWAILAS